MKKLNLIIIALISLVLALSLASCAKPPQAEVDAAKAAVARAEGDPDVPLYAADTLTQAKDSLSRMQADLDAKKYDSAKAAALETVKIAEKAISDAKANKDRLKSSASSVLNALKTALMETEKALASAKKIRGIKLDFVLAADELGAVKRSSADAEKDFNAGSYKAALEKGESAQGQLGALTKKIADAVRAASKKK